MSKATKQAIIDALILFVDQKPGLDYRDYGNRASYVAEKRAIARDKREALQLIAAVRQTSEITADDIVNASEHAFSGRLSVGLIEIPHNGQYVAKIDYCTGQYWPTEYRKAVCAVMASASWYRERDIAAGSTGDSLRRHFRERFGLGMQRRWFN